MYKVILEKPAEKFLIKLDKSIQKRIVQKLKLLEDDPKIGIPLIGNLSGLWKLRIGDYRAIYQIKNEELIVLILDLGHRKNIYD